MKYSCDICNSTFVTIEDHDKHFKCYHDFNRMEVNKVYLVNFTANAVSDIGSTYYCFVDEKNDDNIKLTCYQRNYNNFVKLQYSNDEWYIETTPIFDGDIIKTYKLNGLVTLMADSSLDDFVKEVNEQIKYHEDDIEYNKNSIRKLAIFKNQLIRD